MKIKAITYKLLAVIATLSFASCQDDVRITTDSADGVEMAGLSAHMSRAGQEVAELKHYVGKSEFDDKDRAVFTTIKRTGNPIPQFTYSNIEFVCAASTSSEGVTSIGWSRDKTKGTTGVTTGEEHPDRIYWSDATNPHTFTGYCTPKQDEDEDFDWTEKNGAYYGSIGDPTVHTVADSIDFRSKFNSTGEETLSGNVELRKNDILLTHSTEIKAEDAIAKLYFHHGLAQVRVIVNISDFAAGGGADTLSKVSNMVLKDMLTMYKWHKIGVATEQLKDDDQTILNELYSGKEVNYDQRKCVNLWIPEPKGIGAKSSRTFTFYGMAVPTEIHNIDAQNSGLAFSFNVTYPDPMRPTEMKTHPYNAAIGGIRFDSGKCTTISISLNHKNEKMTVGAEYDDWEFIDTPDQGELKKNSTFLQSTARSIKDTSTGYYNVTIIGDPNANVDDATWLYIDATTKKIVDVYGNDGSADKPFQISTADQLLSFAYEVKGTNRTSVTYKALDGTSKTLSENFDFTGYHVVLDADITLQDSEKKSQLEMDLKKADKTTDEYKDAPALPRITWIGIGDGSHKFNGTFLGGYRHINRLYGSPFFNTIGEDAVVDHIFITDAIGITGTGSIAEKNYGVICGVYIDGYVKENTTARCGSIVGENHSMIIACTHVGDIEGNGTVGALVGYNDGIVAMCYNSGNVKGTQAYAGIGDYTPRSIAYSCYFNSDLYTGRDYSDIKKRIGHVAFPLRTAQMQSNSFVNKKATVDDGGNTTGGEIIDDGISGKIDPFFFHLSLNAGIKRAVVMLKKAVSGTSEEQTEVTIHPASGSEVDENKFEELKLKKSLVKWLIDHYSTEKIVDGKTELEFSHQFLFIPGTYPKLK